MYKDALHVKFVFYVTFQYHHNDERLSLFGLERLELRRLKLDLIELGYLKLLMVLQRGVYVIVYSLLKLIICTIRQGIVIN